MRRRCFIIAAIALVVGVFFQWKSYPSEIVIYGREAVNRSKKQLDKYRGNRRHPLYGAPRSEYVDPHERDSTDLAISYVSLGLAGALLLGGFIIGPPKENS